MGLAASQVRLVFLTSRANDVSFNLQSLAMQRLRLATSSESLSGKLNRALDSEVYTNVWNPNGNLDVNTMALTYNKFMTPGTGLDKQFLLTDSSGKVVLSDDYCTKLGITSGLNSGGSSSITKTLEQFLQALGFATSAQTGTGDIIGTTYNHYHDMMQTFADMKATGDGQAQIFKGWDASKKDIIKQNADDLIAVMQPVSDDLATAIAAETNQLKKSKLQEQKNAVDTVINTLCALSDGIANGESDTTLSIIVGLLNDGDQSYIGPESDDSGCDGPYNYVQDYLADYGVSTNSGRRAHYHFMDWEYKPYIEDIGTNFANFEESLSEDYDDTYGTANNWLNYTGDPSVMPGAGETNEERKAYYTNLYNAAKTNGFVRVSGIENMSEADFEEKLLSGDYKLKVLNGTSWSDYTTSLENQGEISQEVDEEATEEMHDKAQREYDYGKLKLRKLETGLDIRQQQLTTEYNSINTEIDSVKKIIDENTKRSFKIFQG